MQNLIYEGVAINLHLIRSSIRNV